jgi:hypothetical protein
MQEPPPAAITAADPIKNPRLSIYISSIISAKKPLPLDLRIPARYKTISITNNLFIAFMKVKKR